MARPDRSARKTVIGVALVVHLIAEIARGSRGVTYGLVPAPVVIDFWVVDIGGAQVVIDRWHDQGASATLVDRIALASESITFASTD